jgi:protease-4
MLSLKNQEICNAYANSYTQKEYYLNSVASPIYINPVGDMDFKGYLLMFLKIYRKTG